MNHMQTPHRKGFTLIELLTVIAIIGILAAILFPTIGKVMETANKVAASNNARQIATAYRAFAFGTGTRQRTIAKGSELRKNQAQDVATWAGVLALREDLNDAAMWFITADDDVATIAEMPLVVLDSTGEAVDGTFRNAKPKSWVVVGKLPPSAAATTTPVLWTRGLETTGYWKDLSPWKGKGGHIAFLDGHVSWYDNLVTEEGGENLVFYATRSQTGGTENYIMALPESCQEAIYEEEPQ